jgi:hypothetical protein
MSARISLILQKTRGHRPRLQPLDLNFCAKPLSPILRGVFVVNYFAMRRGALIVGEHRQTFLEDLATLPSLVVSFLGTALR